MLKVLVAGGAGFIGGHLAQRLHALGCYVRVADIQNPRPENRFDEFHNADLREPWWCDKMCEGMDYVFNLAADMGGIGYIGTVLASLTRNNILISTNMLEAARSNHVGKFFFSSSACIYPGYKQNKVSDVQLKETDDYPYDPEPGYGWEKLFTEKMCEYYQKDYGLQTYVARFHNVYGPMGTYDGGREKAPAALCRKIALAKDGDTIEIWGDGKQTRSFLYVSDCVDGILTLFDSDINTPVNIGSDRLVTVDELAEMICKIAGKTLNFQHTSDKPQGVRGRCSENSFVKANLKWEPTVPLEEGLKYTYDWINEQVHK